MRLQVEVGRHLFGVESQYFIHGCLVGAQVLWAIEDAHLREALLQSGLDDRAVGINDDLIDMRAGL
ncbi:MAG: hypothetical protein P8Z42_13065 [Anaerolineales bacterium]